MRAALGGGPQGACEAWWLPHSSGELERPPRKVGAPRGLWGAQRCPRVFVSGRTALSPATPKARSLECPLGLVASTLVTR